MNFPPEFKKKVQTWPFLEVHLFFKHHTLPRFYHELIKLQRQIYRISSKVHLKTIGTYYPP